MKHYLLFLLLTLSFFDVSAQSLNNKDVVVSGIVINRDSATSKVITVNFFNPLKHNGICVPLDKYGKFSVKEEMLFTQDMTVNYGAYFIYLYVKPGDSVHLTINASVLNKGDFSWLKISGDNANISSQLNAWLQYSAKLPAANYDFSVPPAVMLGAIKKDYARYMKALNDYAVKIDFDTIAKQYAAHDLKYLVSYYASGYEELDTLPLSLRIDRIKLFTDPFFEMYDPSSFESQMFAIHLDEYEYYITRADTTIAKAIKENRYADAIKKGTAILIKEPAGACRDYMIYHYISFFIDKSPLILDSVKDIRRYFTQTLYTDHLKAFAEFENSTSFPVTPIPGVSYLSNDKTETLPPTDIMAFLTKKYPSKIIYIDVFATWCGPCRAEFKYTPQLHKNFDHRDVVFVNLCLHSFEEKWKKMVKDEHILGENYYLNDDATKLFMGTYRFEGYPAYILIDKKGKIITTHALRPSENIAGELSSLLVTE